MEITQIPNYGRMDQKVLVYMHNGMLFNSKTEKIIQFSATQMELADIMLSKVKMKGLGYRIILSYV